MRQTFDGPDLSETTTGGRGRERAREHSDGVLDGPVHHGMPLRLTDVRIGDRDTETRRTRRPSSAMHGRERHTASSGVHHLGESRQRGRSFGLAESLRTVRRFDQREGSRASLGRPDRDRGAFARRCGQNQVRPADEICVEPPHHVLLHEAGAVRQRSDALPGETAERVSRASGDPGALDQKPGKLSSEQESGERGTTDVGRAHDQHGPVDRCRHGDRSGSARLTSGAAFMIVLLRGWGS